MNRCPKLFTAKCEPPPMWWRIWDGGPLEGDFPAIVRRAGDAPSCLVLEWIMTAASEITQPVQFHEGQIYPREAAHVGWFALRQVLRSWGIASREHLTAKLGQKVFEPHSQATTSLPAHRRSYSVEHVLRTRVALLESVFVALVLHVGRQSSVPVGGSIYSRTCTSKRRSRSSGVATVAITKFGQTKFGQFQVWPNLFFL